MDLVMEGVTRPKCPGCGEPVAGDSKQYARPASGFWRLWGWLTRRRYIFASLPMHPTCARGLQAQGSVPPTPRRLSIDLRSPAYRLSLLNLEAGE